MNNRFILILIAIVAFAGCTDLLRFTGITTGIATEIGPNQAKVSATIDDLSDKPHQQYGFCYGTSTNPTLDDLFIDLGVANSLGSYSASLTRLQPGADYYFRAFIKDGDAVIYGKSVLFSTLTAPLPSVSISEASAITYKSAVLKGKIISGNGDSVTVSGFCYNTATNPTINNNVLINSSGLREFTDTLTGLQSSTKYYVRFFGTNNAGTGYSEPIEFTTGAFARPEVATDSVNKVFDVQAEMYGHLSSAGQGPVIEMGFCYGINADPTVNDKKTSVEIVNGSFHATITGLTNNTQYNVRAYAINDGGISYGETVSFTTKSPARLATVIVQKPNQVNFATIFAYGQVWDDGGGISEYGFALSSVKYKPEVTDIYAIADTFYYTYTTSNNVTTTTTHFGCNIYGLLPNTLYYIRSVAKNSAGIAYSSTESFTTDATGMPTITTFQVQQIMAKSALVISREMPKMSNVPGVTYGICWNTTGDPDINGPSAESKVFSQKYFEVPLTQLLPNTTYYVKAFATYKGATTYGQVISFKTLNSNQVVTDYDGNEYTTVTIGSQVWMQQNMKTKHYADGTTISDYTIYANELAIAAIYGLLYKQDIAVRNIHTENTQGVCPDGWNVPSEGDWETMINYLGGYGVAATELKDSTDIHWTYQNTGTNGSGFTAIGSGVYRDDQVLMSLRFDTYFWTSSPNTLFTEDYTNNKAFGLSSGYTTMSFGTLDPDGGVKSTAVSVRCIKNQNQKK